MRICYLLESTDLGGGVRVVFDQARALARRGHEVTIRALKGDHEWYPYRLHIDYVDRLDALFEKGRLPDAVIGTYWTTIDAAVAVGAPVVMHLCQGFEADIPELAKDHEAIMAAYSRPVPKITVGSWLSDRIEAVFGRNRFPVLSIGQCVDTRLHHPAKAKMKKFLPGRLRHLLAWNLLIVGDYPISCKGVADSLDAVARLRRSIPHVRLTRVSLYPLYEEEYRITEINDSFVRLRPREMADLYRRSDLMISLALPPEGFGLPAAEAMASGVPVVLTKIPSYLGFDDRHDYAAFVDTHDPAAAAGTALDLLLDPGRYRRLCKRGIQVVRKNFNPDQVAANIERAIEGFAHE